MCVVYTRYFLKIGIFRIKNTTIAERTKKAILITGIYKNPGCK